MDMTLLTFKSINIKYYKYLNLCIEVFIPMWSTIFVRERLMQGRLGKYDAEMRGPRLGINTYKYRYKYLHDEVEILAQ